MVEVLLEGSRESGVVVENIEVSDFSSAVSIKRNGRYLLPSEAARSPLVWAPLSLARFAGRGSSSLDSDDSDVSCSCVGG